jgi:TonB-dependent starch-binding outer membrane protein SusC
MFNFKYKITMKHTNSFSQIFWIILLCQLFMSANMFSQEIIVQGTVTNVFLQPLVGAEVKLKGDTITTITDSLGNYVIQANKKGKLIFSYKGYTSITKSIKGLNEIYVVLLQDQSVNTNNDEMANFGYGTMKKKDTAQNSTSVDPNMIKSSSPDDIFQLLKSVPGIEIVGNGEIRIRGAKSFTLSSAPLIIVDGITYSGNLRDINTKDIQAIDVLKDSSATAIYGVNGANGVIIITLKKAK